MLPTHPRLYARSTVLPSMPGSSDNDTGHKGALMPGVKGTRDSPLILGQKSCFWPLGASAVFRPFRGWMREFAYRAGPGNRQDWPPDAHHWTHKVSGLAA